MQIVVCGSTSRSLVDVDARHTSCARTIMRSVALVATGIGLGVLLQRILSRRRGELAAPAPAPTLLAAVPAAQLAPTELEDPSSDDRLLRRIETVLQRRTARVIVVLERLQDGHNYAAVLRTCEALGIQHVWIVSPPKRGDLFETAARRGREANVEFAKQQAEREARREDNPGNPRPVEGSRRQRRILRRTRVWEETDALDAEHVAFAKRAARFLTLRTLESTAECLAALAEDGREIWATDLGQAAVVLAPGAPWLRGGGDGSGGDASSVLPEKLALVIGTESTGVSREMLSAAHRRVYLPQNGFADSLNASAAAACSKRRFPSLVGGDTAQLAAGGSCGCICRLMRAAPRTPLGKSRTNPWALVAIRCRPVRSCHVHLRLTYQVAAALALHTTLALYGPRACGDLAREAPSAEVDALRRRWATLLARDDAQAARMEAAIDAFERSRGGGVGGAGGGAGGGGGGGGEDEGGVRASAAAAGPAATIAPLDDLRRHDVYREHTGRLQGKDRKAARREGEAQGAAGGGGGGESLAASVQ